MSKSIAPAKSETIKNLINSDYIKSRFQEVIGDKAPAFLASVANATTLNPKLALCEPRSVLSAALVAATLDLPIDQNLGFAAIVPYKDVAQFQMMYKGYIQLAMRSGQYKTMNVSEIYEDEYEGYDPVTGEVFIKKTSGHSQREAGDEKKIVGYAAYFKLLNGYEKIEYWPIERIDAHGQRYSKSYKNPDGVWSQNKAAMRAKTVLKSLISKWGPMSTQMEIAVKTDQAVIKELHRDVSDSANIEYVDSPTETSPRASERPSGVNIEDSAKTPDNTKKKIGKPAGAMIPPKKEPEKMPETKEALPEDHPDFIPGSEPLGDLF